jgi:hypothetical protein
MPQGYRGNGTSGDKPGAVSSQPLNIIADREYYASRHNLSSTAEDAKEEKGGNGEGASGFLLRTTKNLLNM